MRLMLFILIIYIDFQYSESIPVINVSGFIMNSEFIVNSKYSSTAHIILYHTHLESKYFGSTYMAILLVQVQIDIM